MREETEMLEAFRCYKEQYKRWLNSSFSRQFWTPKHAETMMYFRLRLIEAGIAWFDFSDELMLRTKFEINARDRKTWSVICGKYSMGGTDGLLEVWDPADAEPRGGYTIDEVMEMVEKAGERIPTSERQPEEVERRLDMAAAAISAERTGEWIRHELWGNPWFTCSECNYHGRNDFNFCPNCGAKMGGDNND